MIAFLLTRDRGQKGKMYNRGWDRFGEEVRRSVQEAVDSGDFSKLNRTIADAVDNAADTFVRNVKDAGDRVNQNFRRQQERYSRHRAYRGMEQGTYRSVRPGEAAQQGQGRERNELQLYSSTTAAKIGGMILSVIGYTGGGLFLIGLLCTLAAAIFVGGFSSAFWTSAVLCTVMMCVFGVTAGAGTRLLGRIGRFRRYIRGLAGKEYGSIQALAQQLGRSPKFVVKDLEKMINKGWFTQGHLDAQKTCLITSNDAYRQYTDVMRQFELRRQEEQEEKEKQKESEQKLQGLSREVREVIQAGEEYIQKIHSCNDAIPGEEISAKITRMEMIVDRIFDRVEHNPELVGDLHRLMGYYLPTTVKLLEAYQDLDAQPIQGENILSPKREIEKTLDTLNVAFEKLLDSMFQDTAWDVSSDISVLHTMLAQEGLTEDAISKRQRSGNKAGERTI